MSFGFFLKQPDYTTGKALTWGNFLGHCHKARSTPDLSLKVAHVAMAALEFIPVVSQVVSLIEMTSFHYFGPSFTNLMHEKTSTVIQCEDPLLHRKKEIQPTAIQANNIILTKKDNTEECREALFSLHRNIEHLYLGLPWPKQTQKIVVFTKVEGGRGDVSAAAKAISLMQRICPTLTFDWALFGARFEQYDPLSFLTCSDLTKIHIRDWKAEPPDHSPADFLLQGPVNSGYGQDYLRDRLHRPFTGPMFCFLENATTPTHSFSFLKTLPPDSLQEGREDELYRTKIHSLAFPYQSIEGENGLPMGLAPGSGVFLDQSRMQAPLSRGYCGPSYIRQIQNKSLQSDILQSMNVFDDHSIPNYDEYSFNSGYAHHSASWGKFIDCVAIHEKNKHITLVLNQNGVFEGLSSEEFQNTILTPSRLAFLQKHGYGTIVLKGENHTTLLQDAKNLESTRRMVIIIRPSFTPNDMKYMQLASERLLATGDNSAAEAWCAKCKLYLYEDCANMGCKWRFLQQQVDVAKKISPTLGDLLALFGGDSRLPDRCLNKPFDETTMAKMERLLDDPDLGNATLQFCDEVCSHYSFEPVLESALKRTAWLHCLPKLATLEANALAENFGENLVAWIKEPASTRTLSALDLSPLGEQISQAVHSYTDVHSNTETSDS